MNPVWDESEFVFCDLQAAARFIRRDNPAAARAFLEAAYDSFEFLARNPGASRTRAGLGFPCKCQDCKGLRGINSENLHAPLQASPLHPLRSPAPLLLS
jgi:hypothetical protein